MEIEIRPPLDEPAARAIGAALARIGAAPTGTPAALTSCWSRASRIEAVERRRTASYALSPRKTRGADRA